MNKSIMNILLTSSILGTHEYEGYLINDERVLECVMDMYFYMLYSGVDNDEKKEEYFNEFGKKYEKLNAEQKDLVKQEYMNIIETQNKNRGKVKKKGMIDYE